VLSVFTGTPGAFTRIACNDDSNGTLQSSVSFSATAGTQYYVMISGFDSISAGRTVLNGTLPISVNAPILTSLAPTGAAAGSPSFTLSANGGNFVSGSVLRWNSSNRSTAFLNPTQLTAIINAGDVAVAGTNSISIINPDGGLSGTLPFVVSATPNATPSLATVSPGVIQLGAPGFTLDVTGVNFAAGATVQWNGSNRPTVFASPAELNASIAAADVAAGGTASITVANPAPGGGVSNIITVNVPQTLPPSQPLPSKPVLKYIPHFLVGGGYISKLTLNNLSAAQNNIVVNLISGNQASGGTLLSSTTYNLAPNASVRIAAPESARSGNAVIDWAIIGADDVIPGNIFFEFADSTSPLHIVNTVGFNDAAPAAVLLMPAEFEPTPSGQPNGRTMGVALANPSATGCTVTLTLLDRAGNALASKQFTLGPFAQTSVDLATTPEFQAVLPPGNFLGAILLVSSAPVVALGVGDDFGPFYSVPLATAPRP